MSTTLQTLPAEQIPASPRVSSVAMGRSDYMSVLLRLTTVELYKLRRRALSKVLLSVAIVGIILTFLMIAFSLSATMSRPTTEFAPPFCSQVPKAVDPNCLNRPPTLAELARDKQTAINSRASNLVLPGSLGVIADVTIFFGILAPLIIILAGTIVGGEYSLGTVRLIFTRGPTRIQFLLAKLVAIGIGAIIGLLAITLAGVLTGYVLHPIFGLAFDFSFFTASWLGHALLYLLMAMLGWFVYGTIALFVGTLGRSTVAGIVSGVTWFLMEMVMGRIIAVVAGQIGGSLGNFVNAIPDYFIGNNISALLHNQAHDMGYTTAASLSNVHALLVLAGYLVVFIGLACWLTAKRDITH